jgi:hypothetical protein
MGDPPLAPTTQSAGHTALPDPYRPLPVVPAEAPTEVAPEEEPITTGTFFLMIVFLTLIGALWALMYLTLVNR